jgi:hypothetical protein
MTETRDLFFFDGNRIKIAPTKFSCQYRLGLF